MQPEWRLINPASDSEQPNANTADTTERSFSSNIHCNDQEPSQTEEVANVYQVQHLKHRTLRLDHLVIKMIELIFRLLTSYH